MGFFENLFKANAAPSQEDLYKRQMLAQQLGQASQGNNLAYADKNVAILGGILSAMGGVQQGLAMKEGKTLAANQAAAKAQFQEQIQAALSAGDKDKAIQLMMQSENPSVQSAAAKAAMSPAPTPAPPKIGTVPAGTQAVLGEDNAYTYLPIEGADAALAADAKRKAEIAAAGKTTVTNTINPAKTDPRLVGAPKDMMWVDPSDVSKGVTPIPGSNAANLSPEQAAKAQLIEGGIAGVEDVRNMLTDEDGSIDRSTVIGMTAGNYSLGESREARVKMLDAIEGKLRAESGAAVPESEVIRIGERFMPSPLDSDELIFERLNMLDGFLKGSYKKIFTSGEYDPRVADEIVNSVFSDSGVGNTTDAIPSIKTDEDYAKLPSGARFIDPDGKVRVKP